jgi:uncharacterized protein (TIGR02270 family)
MKIPAHLPVLGVVQQHAQEAVQLRHVRSVLLSAPHMSLPLLRRHDERMAAHLDGLAVAGAHGVAALEELLDPPSAGAVFALAVCALQGRDASLLTRLVALAASSADAERGFLSALGWVSAEDLQGTVRALLGSKQAQHRAWAFAACAMHRVDPGPILAQATQDTEVKVRARAWRVAGQLGRRELADAARQAVIAGPLPSMPDDPHVVRRAAAWALTLWGAGDNDLVRDALLSLTPGQAMPCVYAHRLATIAAPIDWGRAQVRALAAQAESSKPHKRCMLRLAGWVGDPQVVPWLIHHMVDEAWARLAGESFSVITGADLDQLQLDRPRPAGAESGPNDDPEDEDVALDEDDSLPWPDAIKVQAWWQLNASRFVTGQRYFAGAPPSAAHSTHILRTAGQRQRILAAEYLCLLQPGGSLLPVAAPAWRQSRWLAAMPTS